MFHLSKNVKTFSEDLRSCFSSILMLSRPLFYVKAGRKENIRRKGHPMFASLAPVYKPKNYYMPKALAVKEFAYCEDMNSNYRNKMEDGYFVKDNILDDGGKSILFGVFDGHGQREIVDYLIENFPREFLKQIAASPKDVKKAMEKTFTQLDDSLWSTLKSDDAGSTACIGFIRLEEAKKVLYIANVGDTRAIINYDNTVQRLSYDHKASDPEEALRVQKSGGFVTFGRVGGILAVSRAFGDHSLKKKGVTAVPYVLRLELRLKHKNVVVGSDGIWDVISDDDLAENLNSVSTADELARDILRKALVKGSQDNCSVLVLKLA